jgi:hypothetical protein
VKGLLHLVQAPRGYPKRLSVESLVRRFIHGVGARDASEKND